MKKVKFPLVLMMVVFSFALKANSNSSDRYLMFNSYSVQAPFTFMNPVPDRIRLNNGIDLSFFVNQSIVFQYRYRLDVPKEAIAGFDKGIVNWSGWINNDINEVKIQKLTGKGRYKLMIEYKAHSGTEVRLFEKAFEVYQEETAKNSGQSGKPVVTQPVSSSKPVASPSSVTPVTSNTIPVSGEKPIVKENIPQEQNVSATTAQKPVIVTAVNEKPQTEGQKQVTIPEEKREETPVPVARQSDNIIVTNDIIYKKDGTQIRSKVLEIYSDIIAYKESGIPDAPVRNISVTDVTMVVLENGERRVFKIEEPATQQVQEYSDNSETQEDKYKGNYFMLGVGYGNSYGGAGLMVQMRLGGNVGIGIHAGVGYFPSAPVLAAAGVKIFPYKSFYIDTQFGLTGWEFYSETTVTSYPPYYQFYTYDHLLYGPSLLIGGDWTWGRKIGYGFNAGIGATYNINAVNFSHIMVALDLGFIIRF